MRRLAILIVLLSAISGVSAQNGPVFEDLFYAENATLIEDMGLPTPEPPVQLPADAAPLPVRDCAGQDNTVNVESVSPDGRYMILFTCFGHDMGGNIVYAYDSERGFTFDLGPVNFYPEYWYVERWLDDTRFALQASENDAGTYGTRYLFIGDAGEAGSLRQIASQYIHPPRFEDDPPRYIWSTWDDDNGPRYFVHMYDVASDISAIFFSDECVPLEGFGCPSVVAFPNDSFTFGDVTRFALLFSTPLSLEPKRLEIYEALNRSLIYSAELSDSGRVEWLDAYRLLLLNVSIDLVSGTTGGRIVDTGGDSVIETEIERVYPFEALSPDREWLLVWAVGPDDGAVNVLNLETGEETPLLRPDSDDQFTALLAWDQDDPHTVLARVDIQTGGNPAPVTVWRVGLNNE